MSLRTSYLIFFHFFYFFQKYHKEIQTATSQSTIAQPSTSVQAATCTTPVFWNEKATKMLITEMKILRQSGENGTLTKKKQFMDIAGKLAQAWHTYTWEQVQGKWKMLNAAFKRTKDHNSKSGNDNKNCAFQKELQDMFQGNPTIKPVAIATSSVLPRKKRKAEESS